MPVRKQKKNMKKLSDVLKECKISAPAPTGAAGEQSEKPITGMILDNNENETSSHIPKDNKVPPIFLHKPVYFGQHVRKLLLSGVKFYQPHQGQIYTKINCVSFEDHRSLIQYLKSNKLPYHTYGNPSQRKMKFVMRGLPVDTSLTVVKDELKSMDIPIVRVHKMHTKQTKKEHPLLVLVVVPNNDKGQKMKYVETLLAHKIKVEAPVNKVKQCHRCQKWGHSQRYCHGQIRCVKCAGEHITAKCTRDRNNEPPKCANCGGAHTANFKKCSYCPESEEYKRRQNKKNGTKKKKNGVKGDSKPVQVTHSNCDTLYKNITYFTELQEVF